MMVNLKKSKKYFNVHTRNQIRCECKFSNVTYIFNLILLDKTLDRQEFYLIDVFKCLVFLFSQTKYIYFIVKED